MNHLRSTADRRGTLSSCGSLACRTPHTMTFRGGGETPTIPAATITAICCGRTITKDYARMIVPYCTVQILLV